MACGQKRVCDNDFVVIIHVSRFEIILKILGSWSALQSGWPCNRKRGNIVNIKKTANFNPFVDKLSVGFVIMEIGPNKKIKLVYDEKGQFMVVVKKNKYIPEGQKELKRWKYETSLTLKKEDCRDGDWPKYAAEDMIFEIVEQMKKDGYDIF